MNDAFGRIWIMLTAAYPAHGDKLSEGQLDEQVRLYRAMLKDIDQSTLEAACLQHIATSRWFPTIAELRELAYQIAAPSLQTSGEAWGEVKRNMLRCGVYGKPEFSSQVTERVVRDMGWPALCSSESEMADRAHFMRMYDAYAIRARQDAQMLPRVKELLQLTAGKMERADG